MGVFLYLCLLLLLQASPICGALFTTSNTYISTSFVTLYSNTSDIDTPAANGSHTQTNDRNIIQCNEVTPPNSGLQGVLYDRGTSCQQDTTDIIPALLTNQPKIALVKASGDCNLTQKAYYSALDGAIAVVAFGPFDQGVYTDTTISVQDSINITVYYVDVNVGYSILQQLRQTQPIGYDAANNVTYQTAMKITLFPAIGGFPNAWEFTLLIVVALLLVSFLISVGIHWHLWRIRRRQRMYYDAGVSLGNLDPGRNKNTIDPDCLSHFPTRVIGQVRPVVEESPEDVSVVDQATRPRRPMSILSIRTERALENAEALAATIVHPRKPVVSSSITTTTATDSHSVQEDDTTSVASDVPASPPAQPTPVPPQELPNPQNQQNQQQEEACVICLDDFVHGEVVRKLPCGHEYHCECIDPWLTVKSASCPLCKHDCSIHVLVPEEGDQPLRPEAALTTTAHDNRSQSGFSLSFLRRRMDAENQQRGGATPTSTVSSSFGPTLSVEEAEAFSRSWMARSLPRNMRRQIRQAVQEAHLAQQMHDDEPTVPLPARMTQQSHHETPETTTIAIDVPAAAPTSSSPATFSSHRLFRSLPTQWRS